MDIREIYKKVYENLDRINFESIWPGFHEYAFALYNDKIVYLVDKEIPIDSRFLGNTSITFEGKPMAIWCVSYEQDTIDIDGLTSNLVHEMFHCYQSDQGETRFPDDLYLLRYPDNLENYSLKYQENLYLTKAMYSKESYLHFVEIRQKRVSLIGDIINQEFKAETIEGLAEYCGSQALKQLSLDKYQDRIEKYCNIVSTLSEEQFDIRRMSYYIGTLFFIFSNAYEYSYNHDLSCHETFYNQLTVATKITEVSDFEDKTVVEAETIAETVAVADAEANQIQIIFNKYIQRKSNTINDFISTHKDEEMFDGYLCGYDPMNMIRLSDKLYCSHFIVVKNDSLKEPRFIKGPILLYLKENSNNLIELILK
jgi:hypothetical protein